jgi:hypothetical protein
MFVCTLWGAITATSWSLPFQLGDSLLPMLAWHFVRVCGPLITIGALYDETHLTLCLGISVIALFVGHLATL